MAKRKIARASCGPLFGHAAGTRLLRNITRHHSHAKSVSLSKVHGLGVFGVHMQLCQHHHSLILARLHYQGVHAHEQPFSAPQGPARSKDGGEPSLWHCRLACPGCFLHSESHSMWPFVASFFFKGGHGQVHPPYHPYRVLLSLRCCPRTLLRSP